MNYIIESVSHYLYLFFFFCFLEVVLLKYYKKKKIKINIGFIIGYQILICILVTIYTITGIPGINNLVYQSFKHMNLTLYLENLFSFDCVMNIIMFMPIGIVLPLLWKNAQKLYKVMITGISLSLFIEIMQLFSYRASDLNDVLTNVIGTLFGYIIYKYFAVKLHFFELDDDNKLLKFHSFFQVLLISIAYFIIGLPILSLISGF